MSDRSGFRPGVFIPVLLVLLVFLTWTPAGNAADTGKGCSDCHKARPVSPGQNPNVSNMVHIGGVSPHRASSQSPSTAGAAGTGPARAPGLTNPSSGAPKTR